jgi:hypothetical protein
LRVVYALLVYDKKVKGADIEKNDPNGHELQNGGTT